MRSRERPCARGIFGGRPYKSFSLQGSTLDHSLRLQRVELVLAESQPFAIDHLVVLAQARSRMSYPGGSAAHAIGRAGHREAAGYGMLALLEKIARLVLVVF